MAKVCNKVGFETRFGMFALILYGCGFRMGKEWILSDLF